MSIESTEIEPLKHGRAEDLLGLFTGVALASLGLFLLRYSGSVTGGTAGLALLVSLWVDDHVDLGWLASSFQVLFVLINLPFFVLAWWKKGWVFTLKSLICVVTVSVLIQVHTEFMHLEPVNRGYAVVIGNLLAGVGLLILFRHLASLGGFNIVALLAQEKLGWRAGYVQMSLDVVVVAASLLIMPLWQVTVSAFGVVVLNIVLAFNHRPGRYVGY
ncbi:MAG: YitT family protein [Nocardioides sp.]